MADVKILSSPPLRVALRELSPRFERATGHTLMIKTGPLAELKRQIDAGEAFDVAILTPDLIDAFAKRGKIVDHSSSKIARSGLGVAVRTGEHMLDVGSTQKFKVALLNATSIMYASGSAVTTYIERMFERLGIADGIKWKCKLLPAGGYIGEAIAAGEAELGLTHIPVILESAGVRFAGPLPTELQFHVDFCAGVSAESMQPEPGEALIRYLMTPEATAVLESKGLECFIA